MVGSKEKVDWSEWFYYDETSPSCLRWKVDRYAGAKYSVLLVSAGYVAGYLDSKNYWRVSCNGQKYRAHRIIYELMIGPIPQVLNIDHINGSSSDNRVGNLRVVSQAVNSRNQKKMKNNTSRVTGVSLTGNGCGVTYWHVQWMLAGKKRHKRFSIAKLGNDEAFKLACEYREKMIKELNKQGAGYSEDHGVR